VELDLSK